MVYYDPYITGQGFIPHNLNNQGPLVTALGESFTIPSTANHSARFFKSWARLAP